MDKELEAIIKPQQEKAAPPPPDAVKLCESCEKPFNKASPRQKYCTSCGESMRKHRRAEAERRRRQSAEED